MAEMDARLAGVQADLVRWVISVVSGAVVVNVLAMTGAMFGLAKLLGH
jgi:hypothetical protein